MPAITSAIAFVGNHRSDGDSPDDPALFSIDEIMAYAVPSTVASAATSTVTSQVASGGLGSIPISTADSKAVSSGTRASVADSKAISQSVNTSVADSKATSVSGNTSIADSKATSVATALIIPTVNSLPGFLQAGADAVVRTANSKMADVIHVKDYGVVADGVVDDTIALQNALDAIVSTGGTLIFPPGTIKISSALTVTVTGTTPKAVVLQGSPHSTTLKPTSGVATCLTILGESNSNGILNRLIIDGIDIDGVLTSGKTGLVVGQTGSTTTFAAYVTISNCQIFRFAGSGGIGLYVKNAVACRYVNVYVARCETNLYMLGDPNPGFPTTQLFEFCHFREADGKGVNIVNSYQTKFEHCVFEANTQEGLYIVPTSGTHIAINISVDGCWFEGNYPASGSDYQLKADGSLAGTVMLRIANSFFSSDAKSISLKYVVNLVIDNIYPFLRSADVLVDTGCVGAIMNWPENNAPSGTTLTNNAQSTTAFYGGANTNRADTFQGRNLIATGGASVGVAGQIVYGGTTAATATNGTGEAMKANVEGYIIVNIAGTDRKIPYVKT